MLKLLNIANGAMIETQRVVQSLQPDVRPHSMEISARVVPRLLNIANGGMIETQIDGKL